MQELEGRVAVVTGGGSGIGEALIRACADAGMSVVVADLCGERAEGVAPGAARI
jgi:NAD(P)-dependent dehydrogenase (short-subunit alcohol dehydrogenase family)